MHIKAMGSLLFWFFSIVSRKLLLLVVIAAGQDTDDLGAGVVDFPQGGNLGFDFGF